MQTSIDKEIEQLEIQIRQARTESTLVGAAFVLAIFATGYFTMPWIVESTHLGTSALFSLMALCCFLGGSLLSVLLILIFRLRAHRSRRHSATTRMQAQLLHSHGKDEAK